MTVTLTISPDQERIIRAIGSGILIYTGAAAVIGAVAWGFGFMAGAVLGGGLMWANYRAFVHFVRGMLAAAVAGQGSAKWFAVKLALVEFAVFGAVAAVVAADVVSVIGFLVGLLSLLGSIAGVGLGWPLWTWYRTRGQQAAMSAD